MTIARITTAGRFAPEQLFRPDRVTVLGADGPQGAVMIANLIAARFHGAILPVAVTRAVGGILAYPDVASLPAIPDLAVLCAGVDASVAIPALAARGCFAAIVMGDGTPPVVDPIDAGPIAARPGPLRALAERTGVRTLGPASFGLAVPAIGLDATLGHMPVRAGRAALVSQSAALCRAVLDWAGPNGVGFSHVVGIGDNDDIGFAMVLDWLARDSQTGAILLDIRQLKDARAFLSAARAAARLRPVVALQSGARRRDPQGATEAALRAALGRAGVLCVDAFDELLGAAETLARAKPALGQSVAVVANAHGAADLAADAVLRSGLSLTGESLCVTARDLPEAVRRVGVGHGVGAVLVVHAPDVGSWPDTLVAELASVARDARPPVIACAMGGEAGAGLQRALAQAGLAAFRRPEAAVRAVLHLVDDRRNRANARELPTAEVLAVEPDRAAVARVMAGPGGALCPAEVGQVFAAYGIVGERAVVPANTLAIRVGSDPLWGPLIGVGPAWSLAWREAAVDLPPLNLSLAHAMLRRLPMAGALPEPVTEALADTLVRMSALLVDQPRIVEGWFDPGHPAGGCLRVMGAGAAPRLALPPFPAGLARMWVDRRGAPALIRPIRPEDADAHAAFFARLSPEDVRYRFFAALRELSAEQIVRMTNIDYDREMAFVAVREGATVGVARLVREAFVPEGEFAVLVQPDAKGAGLAEALMGRLFDWARAEGIRAVVGQVLTENRPMLAFVRHLGFAIRRVPDEHAFVEVRKELAEAMS